MRLYRVESPEGDVQTAMIVVRRVLARCARPPISLSARGTLARPAAVAAIAAAAPRARVEAVLDVPPAEPGRLAATLREQPLDAWFAEQAASGFGSAFWIGSDRDEPRASQLTLSFTAEPGQEQAERPRAERWLSALAEAGLLPSAASPERVAAWFFTHVRAEPGHPPPNPSPGTVQNDVRIRSFGWRGTADRPPVYGPAAIELTVPLPPPVALARAVPLLDAAWADPLQRILRCRPADRGGARGPRRVPLRLRDRPASRARTGRVAHGGGRRSHHRRVVL